MQRSPCRVGTEVQVCLPQTMKLRRPKAHHAPFLDVDSRASAQQAAELAWIQASIVGRPAVISDGESASRAAEVAWARGSTQSAYPLAPSRDERDRALQAAHLAWHAPDLSEQVDRLEGTILQTRPYSSAYFMLDPLKRRRCVEVQYWAPKSSNVPFLHLRCKLCAKSLGPKESMVSHYWAWHGLFCLLCGGVPAGLSPAKGYSPARILKHWQHTHGMQASASDVFEAINDAKVEALLWREQSVSRARAVVKKPDTSISARHGEHYKRRLESEHDCTDGRKRHGVFHGFRALFQDIRRGRSESISNRKLRKMGFGPKREDSVKQKPKRRWWQIGQQKKKKRRTQQSQPARGPSKQNSIRKRGRQEETRPAAMKPSGRDRAQRH